MSPLHAFYAVGCYMQSCMPCATASLQVVEPRGTQIWHVRVDEEEQREQAVCDATASPGVRPNQPWEALVDFQSSSSPPILSPPAPLPTCVARSKPGMTEALKVAPSASCT